jgi:hypothetical protein
MHRSSRIIFYIALALAAPALAHNRREQESGSATSPKTRPSRRTTTYDYDARSFNAHEHLPSTQNPNTYESDASRVLKQYTDRTGEQTTSTNDGIGRPVRRN